MSVGSDKPISTFRQTCQYVQTSGNTSVNVYSTYGLKY